MLTGPPEFDALGSLEIVAERETVSFALLLWLERLTPAERAVYVQHEAFGYGHREVAEVIGMLQANARRLASRAGKKLLVSRGVSTRWVGTAGWSKGSWRAAAVRRRHRRGPGGGERGTGIGCRWPQCCGRGLLRRHRTHGGTDVQ